MNPLPNPWHISADDFPEDGYSSDQLEFLVGYAVLAPSNYNTQPWQFRVNAADLEVHADRRRAIRTVDPYDRELTLSCGAAIFNLRVAAEYFGHQYTIELLPEPADRSLVARLRFGLRSGTGAEDILLFHAITRRHTNRQPFLPDPVPPEILAALQAAAAAEHAWLEFVEGDDRRAAVAELVAEADRVQWADRHFRDERAQWLRVHGTPAVDGIPAPALGVKGWLSFAGPTLVRAFDQGSGQATHDREILAHSPVLAVLGTDGEDWSSWLAAGQALQHVLLAARAENLWASFLCQPIEVADLRGQLAGLLPRSGHPQVLLRLGYGPEVPPSPRRPPRDLLIRRQHGHA